jgi:DNA-binding transcriptional regulator YdaS (Cro superfamily)
MNLKDYFNLKRGNAKRLAEKLEVSLSYLSQLASGAPVSPEMCVRIEQLTGGQVTRKCLKENWEAIWPELTDQRHISDRRQNRRRTHIKQL